MVTKKDLIERVGTLENDLANCQIAKRVEESNRQEAYVRLHSAASEIGTLKRKQDQLMAAVGVASDHVQLAKDRVVAAEKRSEELMAAAYSAESAARSAEDVSAVSLQRLRNVESDLDVYRNDNQVLKNQVDALQFDADLYLDRAAAAEAKLRLLKEAIDV